MESLVGPSFVLDLVDLMTEEEFIQALTLAGFAFVKDDQ